MNQYKIYVHILMLESEDSSSKGHTYIHTYYIFMYA